MIGLKESRQITPRTIIMFGKRRHFTPRSLAHHIALESALRVYRLTYDRGNRQYGTAPSADINRIQNRIHHRIYPTCKWIFDRLNPK